MNETTGKCRCIWEVNIKMNVEIGLGGRGFY
jgi:hypothetical protein